MKRFIQSDHRGQSTLLPESFDDYVIDTPKHLIVHMATS